jgi:hypothetical protein
MEPIREFLRIDECARAAALTHLYLELGLPPAHALQAADADLAQTVRTRCEKAFWEKLRVASITLHSVTLHNEAGTIGPAMSAIESELRRCTQAQVG